MSTVYACLPCAHGADSADAPVAPSDPPSVWYYLFALDALFLALGCAFVVVFVVRYALRRRGDPLRKAPPRPSQFREESVALPVLGYLFAALILSSAVSLATGDPEGVLSMVIVGNGAQIVGALTCILIAHKQFAGGAREFVFGPGGEDSARSPGLTVALAVAGIGLCPVISELTALLILTLTPHFEMPHHPTLEVLTEQDVSALAAAALWFGAMLIAPVAEEVFFRGILQTALISIAGSRWTAIGLASLVFGLVHYRQPQAVPALIALGAIMGYAYERTGSLLPPIAIHAAFNAKTLIWGALSGWTASP